MVRCCCLCCSMVFVVVVCVVRWCLLSLFVLFDGVRLLFSLLVGIFCWLALFLLLFVRV